MDSILVYKHHIYQINFQGNHVNLKIREYVWKGIQSGFLFHLTKDILLILNKYIYQKNF
jgi:hypothetical protein